MLNLAKLFTDVFDPQAGELAAVMVDSPHADVADNDEWRERRAMAARWHAALSEFGAQRGFAVRPLIEFSATGANNGDLPPEACIGDRVASFDEIASTTTLLLALTEFSASAPLIGLTRRFPQLRAASMPRIAPQMEETALAADYRHVAQSCRRLRGRLAEAALAQIEFSTGDEFKFDFRFREPEMDDGRLHRDQPPPRLINLPSGETYVAAYEGEGAEPSATAGVLPVWWKGAAVRLRIAANRVEEVLGDSPAAESLRAFLFADAARRNVAELGLGCNPKARVWGNVLEDEKAGPHIALGRSDHLGGTVGPDAFADPRHVWHEDFVYARNCPLRITRMTLVNSAGAGKVLFADGSYDRELEIGI